MMINSKNLLRAVVSLVLAALGFSACSKPDDDPVSQGIWGIPGVYAYGPLPQIYQYQGQNETPEAVDVTAPGAPELTEEIQVPSSE